MSWAQEAEPGKCPLLGDLTGLESQLKSLRERPPPSSSRGHVPGSPLLPAPFPLQPQIPAWPMAQDHFPGVKPLRKTWGQGRSKLQRRKGPVCTQHGGCGGPALTPGFEPCLWRVGWKPRLPGRSAEPNQAHCASWADGAVAALASRDTNGLRGSPDPLPESPPSSWAGRSCPTPVSESPHLGQGTHSHPDLVSVSPPIGLSR